MNWEMIGTISGIIFIMSCVFIAAAKSIFVTKKQIYNESGVPIYLVKTEWEKSKDEREQRRDTAQRKLCEQMTAIQQSQSRINDAVNILIGRFDQEYGRVKGA